MARSSWPAAKAFVWRTENDGQGFHTDPHDSGKETDMGITDATWKRAILQGIVRDVTLDYGTDDEFARILLLDYWKPCSCDSLSIGVDLAVFNMAMVAGVGRASIILQTVVGAYTDGDIGPLTRTSAMDYPGGAFALVKALTTEDERFYAQCPTARYFLRGWDRRAEDCQAECIRLIKDAGEEKTLVVGPSAPTGRHTPSVARASAGMDIASGAIIPDPGRDNAEVVATAWARKALVPYG